jgi:hypothetical protein
MEENITDLSGSILSQLSPEEKAWWASTIKEFRAKYIVEPKKYADNKLSVIWDKQMDIESGMDEIISSTREEIYQHYLRDESIFHSRVLQHLFTQRELPATILGELVKGDYLRSITDDDRFLVEVGKLMGDYAGRVMPYIYELALSTTQSRRSRAGKTFEQLIESLLEKFDVPYDTQGSVSSGSFNKLGLGKKVDAIVPSVESYDQNRSKCAVVTMKTSLRERWQEVAEELSRTNVPHIYLLTVDQDITTNVVNTIKNYNIQLVVYQSQKNSKFISNDNVCSFYHFFDKEMGYIMNYWGENEI